MTHELPLALELEGFTTVAGTFRWCGTTAYGSMATPSTYATRPNEATHWPNGCAITRNWSGFMASGTCWPPVTTSRCTT